MIASTLAIFVLLSATPLECFNHPTGPHLANATHQRKLTRSLKLPTQLDWFHPDVNISRPATRRSPSLTSAGIPCHPHCTLRGNCNADEGRCECPYGYTGPSCQEMLIPACRLTDAPDAIATCHEPGPWSCECHRQCARLQCGLLNEGTGKCANRRLHHPACWHWPGLPPHMQLSTVPEESDTAVVYYDSYQHEAAQTITRQQVPGLSQLAGQARFVSERLCPQACSHRGRCQLLPGRLQPHCRCYLGYYGRDCSLQRSDQQRGQSCINNCSGRGSCSYGFCHCQRGWWGLDCSRHTSHNSSSRLPPRHRARIYVYELPTWVSWRPLYEYTEIYRSDLVMLKMLLGDWSVRTANPHEANLFYIPTFATFHGGNVGWQQGAAGHIEHIIRWIKATHPFWNRTGGRDHFYWVSNDWGVCKYPNTSADLHNPIRVVHFGYHTGGRQHNPWYKHTWDCFDVHKDIVAAPLDAMHLPQPGHTWPGRSLQAYVSSKRKLLMYSGWLPTDYVGWIPGGKMPGYYSFGARQALASHFQNNTDPAIVISSQLGQAYIPTIQDSLFCLNPVGFGWAIRIATAATYGCIPVTLQDGVYQPWHDLLPYHEFSLRFSVADIQSMVPQLRQVPYKAVVRMYRSLQRYRRAFLWQRELGGEAFDYLVASLMERLQRMWGLVY